MLRLGGLEITRLSGPVSFTYLVPKEDAFLDNAAKGTFLPIVVLLGDHHKDYENSCDDCEEEKGCYKVEGDRFLGAINRVGRDIPIDFYIESHSEEANYESTSPLAQIITDTKGCRNVVERKSSSYNCKFKNVRWHKSDPRVTIDKLESVEIHSSYMANMESEFENNARQISSLMGSYGGIYTKSDNLLVTFISALRDSIIDNDTFDGLSLKVAKMFTKSIIGNSKSMIYKQLTKSKIDVNIELYFYRSISKFFSNLSVIDENVIDIFSGAFSKRSPLLLNAEKILERIIMMTMSPYSGRLEQIDSMNRDRYITMIKFINQIYSHVNIGLVDLYFTLRMLKTPKGNVNSYVSIGFFGARHCKDIADFLSTVTDYYKVVASSYTLEESDENPNRCITFDKDVDVDADLERYAEMRQKHEQLTVFKDVLQEEYQSRGENF